MSIAGAGDHNGICRVQRVLAFLGIVAGVDRRAADAARSGMAAPVDVYTAL